MRGRTMDLRQRHRILLGAACAAALAATLALSAAEQPRNKQPASGPDRLKSDPTAGGKALPDRAEVAKKQRDYLEKRYDLSGKTDPNTKMSGGRKNVPVGPTA